MMLIYLLFIFLLILICYGKATTNNNVINNNATICLFLSCSLLIAVFMGCRNKNIGLDSCVYLQIFHDYKSYTSKLEPGFLLLNTIIGFFTDNDNVYLFIITYLITFLQLLNYILTDKKNAFYYLLLYVSFYYFYQFNFNIMREGLAITIVSLGFIFYKKKKYVLYLLFGLLAVTIHSTAVIFLLYPFFSIKITKKRNQIVLFLVLLLFMFTRFTSILISSVPSFHWAIDKIKWYFIVSDSVKLRFSHLISICIILLFTINFDKMKKSKFFYLYTFHTVFFVFLGLFHECVLVYDRFYFYLQVFEPILIYEFNILFKEKKLYNTIIIILVVLMSIFTIFIWGPRNFISPYKFFWE